MVNLVIRTTSSHLQGNAPVKLPVIATSRTPLGKATSERRIPSPIRVPFAGNNNNNNSGGGGSGARRPLSPLAAQEYHANVVGHHPRGPMSECTQLISLDVSTTDERQPPSLTSVPSSSGVSVTGDELVCDYDQSVTPLYEFLESSQWDQARNRCQTHPTEVHTWIVRRNDHGGIRWKLLPLHAAVIFQSPMSVVDAMLAEHPLAVAKRDDQGMLPLHLAFRHKLEESIVERLLHQYPGGVVCRDRRDRLPLDHGREARFSARMMQLYSETYAKCLGGPSDQNGPAVSAANTAHEATIKSSYEARMQVMKDAYEARIAALDDEHEQSQKEFRLRMEQTARAAQSQHNQEMDDLRDLLAREVAKGHNSDELQLEAQRLRDSLAESSQESKVLRRVLREQETQREVIVEELRQVSKDQKVLHELCQRQQEQLDQAQQLREQLLSKLLQKEDGRATRVSNELSELSQKILARTEKALNEVASAAVTEVISKDAPAAVAKEDDNIVPAQATGPTTTGRRSNPATPIADDERRLRAENYRSRDTAIDDPAWEDDHHHDDDISAITENTNF